MSDEHWPALCRELGREALLGDARLATPRGRQAHREELTHALAEAFLSDLATNWRRRLLAAGVPTEISVDTWDGETILFDAELERLGPVAEYHHPLLGRICQFGNLITFSDTPGRQERPTPMLGEHTREILTSLGYGEDAIDGFRDRGVVTWPDDRYPFRV